MFTFRMKIAANILIISALLFSGLSVLSYGQNPITCDQCGMTLDDTGQARYRILDSNGNIHLACCPICALKLQRTYGDLNITSFCDYYGPNFPITIITKNNGTDVTVNPPDALIIAAGSCIKNRLVYNSSAADALLASPNNGTSKWLSPLTNATVLANATRLSVAQAALINGVGLPTPTPSPSPSPTPTLSLSPSSTPSLSPSTSPSTSPSNSLSPTPTNSPVPTATGLDIQICEVCGMDVTPESQNRYTVTDGNGNVHYVECYMCALQLINDYETLHIETYCDWYGPNYPITVDSHNYGALVTVNPSTAIFLRGGSCVTARIAYNQTAADNLLSNGFSQNTSPEQHYALPSKTQVKLVDDAISTWYAKAEVTTTPTLLILALGLVIGAVIIGGSILAFKKLKTS
jgi:hypothetical protein